MEETLRGEFLSTWKYPSFIPQEDGIWGRLVEWGNLGVLLWKDFEYIRNPLVSGVLHGKKYSQDCLKLLLREGDLVFINSKGDLVLLAPQREPWSPPRVTKKILLQWMDFMEAVKVFWKSQSFLEIHTPTLVPCPGSEPSLEVYRVLTPQWEKAPPLFLPTSPEWHLKKALSWGYEKIFEIRPCFRYGENSEKHSSEFWMLEWYRAFTDLKLLKKDVVELVHFLCEKFQCEAPIAVESFTIKELFYKEWGEELTPETGEDDLRRWGLVHGVDLTAAESVDDCFFLLWMEVEKKLDPRHLIFVENYPPYQAALAQINAEGWGERFECYWKGLELGNAFFELTDPQIQKQRFKEDLIKRAQMGKTPLFEDAEFFKALERGIPPSSGIAMGLDRLFMAVLSKEFQTQSGGSMNIQSWKLFNSCQSCQIQ